MSFVALGTLTKSIAQVSPHLLFISKIPGIVVSLIGSQTSYSHPNSHRSFSCLVSHAANLLARTRSSTWYGIINLKVPYQNRSHQLKPMLVSEYLARPRSRDPAPMFGRFCLVLAAVLCLSQVNAAKNGTSLIATSTYNLGFNVSFTAAQIAYVSRKNKTKNISSFLL